MRLGGHGRSLTLLGISLLYVVPFYLIILNSFKAHADIVRDPFGIPVDRLTLGNYQAAVSDRTFDVIGSYAATGVITGASVVLIIVLGAALSYVMSRRRGIWQLLYLLLLLGFMIPPQVILIPVVKVLAALGLLFSLPGLIAYYVGVFLPLAAFIYVPAMRAVPRELDEAAAIDGAGPVRTFAVVVFPLVRPATATVAILLTLFIWNDYVNPQVLLGTSVYTTAVTGLVRSVGVLTQNWGLVFAFCVLVSLPVIVLYLVAQRFVVNGLAGGAVK